MIIGGLIMVSEPKTKNSRSKAETAAHQEKKLKQQNKKHLLIQRKSMIFLFLSRKVICQLVPMRMTLRSNQNYNLY
jgi:hypothetical protein